MLGITSLVFYLEVKMNQIIEVNIADVLVRLEAKMDKLDNKIDALEEKLTNKIDALEEKLTNKIDAVEQKLESKIDALDKKIDGVEEKLTNKIESLSTDVNLLRVSTGKLEEKITGLDKRLGNIEFVARSIAGAVIIALLLAFARYLFPNVTL
jgi:chromosome segregation ATPase